MTRRIVARIILADGRGLVALADDDGPHVVTLSYSQITGEVRVYVDGRDGQWRWARPGECPENEP